LTFIGSGDLDLTNNELMATATASSIRANLASGAIFTSHAGVGTGVGYAAIAGGLIDVRFALLGDTNLDGSVNVAVLGALATAYGLTGSGLWSQGDINYDAAVDVADLGALATNYGNSLAAASATSAFS